MCEAILADLRCIAPNKIHFKNMHTKKTPFGALLHKWIDTHGFHKEAIAYTMYCYSADLAESPCIKEKFRDRDIG